MQSRRIGDVKQVENKKRKPGANRSYFHLRGQTEDGKEAHYLFSEHQLKVAAQRAKDNPEDCIKPSFIRDLVD